MSVMRATSFRAAFGFTAILVLALALVLSLLYARLEARLAAVEEARIWREAASLTRTYAQGGVKALAEAVTAQADTGQGLALHLTDRLGLYLAGNIKNFPAPEATHARTDGWFDMTVQDTTYRARLVAPDDDLVLLLGFDRGDMDAYLTEVRGLFVLTLIGLTLLGGTGAALLARRNLARVAQMNRYLQPVMQGALNTRLPGESTGDEWALMASHINAMLARLEKLVDATREVSDNLAHDLRAPLTRLRMRLEALSESAEDAQFDQLADAMGDVDALLSSFNALLALSRLEGGTIKLARRPVDVSSLMENLYDLFEAVFEVQDMTLRIEADAVSGMTGDEALLSQALVNGLENALAHGARPAGTVTLGVQDVGDAVILSVTDEGPGIAAADRDRAIERFVRLDESRSGDGTGLGLSLIAAICHHHGGTLSLGDNAPGLRLTLHLPKG